MIAPTLTSSCAPASGCSCWCPFSDIFRYLTCEFSALSWCAKLSQATLFNAAIMILSVSH